MWLESAPAAGWWSAAAAWLNDPAIARWFETFMSLLGIALLAAFAAAVLFGGRRG